MLWTHSIIFCWNTSYFEGRRKRMKESKWPHCPRYISAILARKHGDCSKVRWAKSITSNVKHLPRSVRRRGRIDGWFQFGFQLVPDTFAPSFKRKELGGKQVQEEGVDVGPRPARRRGQGGGEAHKYAGRRAGVTDKCDLLGLHPTQRWQVSLLGWYYPAITRTDGPL